MKDGRAQRQPTSVGWQLGASMVASWNLTRTHCIIPELQISQCNRKVRTRLTHAGTLSVFCGLGAAIAVEAKARPRREMESIFEVF